MCYPVITLLEISHEILPRVHALPESIQVYSDRGTICAAPCICCWLIYGTYVVIWNHVCDLFVGNLFLSLISLVMMQQGQYQSFTMLALYEGNPSVTDWFSHKGPVIQKTFSCHGNIMFNTRILSHFRPCYSWDWVKLCVESKYCLYILCWWIVMFLKGHVLNSLVA